MRFYSQHCLFLFICFVYMQICGEFKGFCACRAYVRLAPVFVFGVFHPTVFPGLTTVVYIIHMCFRLSCPGYHALSIPNRLSRYYPSGVITPRRGLLSRSLCIYPAITPMYPPGYHATRLSRLRLSRLPSITMPGLSHPKEARYHAML